MPARQRLGRAPVQQPTARERRPFENNPPQRLEWEVVRDGSAFGAGGALFEQPVADRLVEGVGGLGIASATHRTDQVGVEPALQHSRRRHDLDRRLLDGVDAALEQIADAGRRTLDRPVLRGPDVLHDKEWQAPRLC